MTPPATAPVLDVARVRKDFPILASTVHGKPLVYLDSAATTQKPQAVIDALTAYYAGTNANVHRGVHRLSELATDAYEGARKRIAAFIGAASEREVVFTRGTTEAINLVASTYGQLALREGDEVLISGMEHHSNIVPWQLACERHGAKLVAAALRDDGSLDLDDFRAKLGDRTRMVAVVHVSNALGTVNPVAEIVRLARAQGVPVLLDGAQAVPHMEVDVQALGCDFYAFSGHKLFGPTGIGVLWAKERWLEQLPPYQGGGDMIRTVTVERSTWNDLPYKFEAGTPHIAGAIGLGAAVDYLQAVGMGAIARHEADLLAYAERVLDQVPGLRRIGTAPERAGVVSFVLKGVHPHDLGTILDRDGIAIRTGHHCAQPVMERFQVPATARASFALYNAREDVDALVRGLERVKELFS